MPEAAIKHMAGESPHRIELRVYYEDTDAGGIVYYANYLKFAERGRTECLRDLGFDHVGLLDSYGFMFAVRKATVEYIRPARLDDVLAVETTVVKARGAAIEMVQKIKREGEVLSTVDVKLACIDAAGRPVRLPAELAEKLIGRGPEVDEAQQGSI